MLVAVVDIVVLKTGDLKRFAHKGFDDLNAGQIFLNQGIERGQFLLDHYE